jgi:hypothetical protein
LAVASVSKTRYAWNEVHATGGFEVPTSAFVVATVLIGLLITFGVRRLIAPAAGAEDLDEFRPFDSAFYKPMERLLRGSDIEFLKSQPGYRAGMERRLEVGHRLVLRGYLRALRADYVRLHRAARYLLAHSTDDRPELAVSLVRESLRFWTMMAWAVVSVEISRFGPGAGLSGVRGLIEAPRWMESQIAGLVRMPEPAW